MRVMWLTAVDSKVYHSFSITIGDREKSIAVLIYGFSYVDTETWTFSTFT